MTVFHASTARDDKGELWAVGGRVLGVSACGADIRMAQERAYRAVDKMDWPDGFYRRDIGWRERARQES